MHKKILRLCNNYYYRETVPRTRPEAARKMACYISLDLVENACENAAMIRIKMGVLPAILALGAAAAQTGPPDASWGADRLASTVRTGDTAVAVEAAKALAEIKDSEVAYLALAGAVESRKLDAPVRLASIRALQNYGDARAAECYVGVLGDDDVRWAAADALIHFRTDGVTSRLMNVLAGDRKAKRRAAAAYALGRFREPAAFPTLLAALRDKDEEVRIRVCAAVAAYNDRAAVEPLIANLETDKKWRGRVAAASALGAVPDERSVRPLSAALDDKQPEVRATAAASLAAVGDMRAMDPLRARSKKEKDAAARKAIAQALEDLKAGVLERVKP
jgi:HEAT repeat protein